MITTLMIISYLDLSIKVFLFFAILRSDPNFVNIDSFPSLHYPTMIKETLEIIHVVNTVIFFVVGKFNYSKILLLVQLLLLKVKLLLRGAHIHIDYIL
jgi:hypothetical protein